MKKHVGLVSCVLALAACSEIPAGAYYNRGDPENLLDVSSEVVNMSLSSPGSLAELTRTLAQDPPSRAELHCSSSDTYCTHAKSLLDHHGVASKWAQGGHGVTLVYDRVMARDCENRYIDNSINPYNLEPPTFGCSLMGNTVQMVSDKRQFVNPSLLDFQDAGKTTQIYERYLKAPPEPVASSNDGYAISTMSGAGAGGR